MEKYSIELITRGEALEFIMNNWTPDNNTEWVALPDALGRVTAETLYARYSLPVYRVSSIDGIAVKFEMFENGVPDPSNWVKGVDYVRADTGDDFPDEFDTVIAVEDIILGENGTLLGFPEHFEEQEYVKGDCVRAAGTRIKTGEVLVEENTRLEPLHLAVLALGGVYQLKVIRKPKVVYIPTGDEMIPAGLKPGRGDHIETNGLMVKGYLENWGADAVCFPIIRDDVADLEAALDEAIANADIVLINGGSSMGEEDHNASMLRRKATAFRHGIRMRPGYPVAIAIINGKIAINLPGPTLATWLAMDWCVSAVVHRFLNQPAPKRPTVKAKLAKPIRKELEWDMFGRFYLEKDAAGDLIANQVGRRETEPTALLKPNGVYIVPIGVSELPEGEEIDVELTNGLEFIG